MSDSDKENMTDVWSGDNEEEGEEDQLEPGAELEIGVGGVSQNLKKVYEFIKSLIFVIKWVDSILSHCGIYYNIKLWNRQNIAEVKQSNLSVDFQRKIKKKSGKKWRKGKDRSNPNGQKKVTEVEERKKEQYTDIVHKLKVIGDPYDHMDMKTKKTHAFYHLYQYMKIVKYAYDCF